MGCYFIKYSSIHLEGFFYNDLKYELLTILMAKLYFNVHDKL